MNDTDTHIRPAEFKDAQGIFDLIKSFPQELIPRAIGDIVQNIDRFLVAEQNERVVGVVSWQIMPEIGATARSHSVEIKSVAVDISCHGQGIGRQLIHAAIERIRPLHTSEIIVLTFSPPFFETLGFHEVPKEKLMHKIYTGCINCTKYDSPFTCPEVAMVLPME
jgi:amino-acid N-acetyltransferase